MVDGSVVWNRKISRQKLLDTLRQFEPDAYDAGCMVENRIEPVFVIPGESIYAQQVSFNGVGICTGKIELVYERF